MLWSLVIVITLCGENAELTVQNDPPALVEGSIHTGKNYINVTWAIAEGQPESELLTICVASKDDNADYSWIVWSGHTKTPITDTSSSYSVSVENLSPFTNYTCDGLIENVAGNSSATDFEIRTEEDVPPKPKSLNITNVSPYSFTMEWDKLEEVPGVLMGYGLYVLNLGPQRSLRIECMNNFTSRRYFDIKNYQVSYDYINAFPYFRYAVTLYGIGSAGNGTAITAYVNTKEAEPDSVTNPEIVYDYPNFETYYGVATVKFSPPCKINGPFKHYYVNYTATREGFWNTTSVDTINVTEFRISLLPDTYYSVTITVVTENYESRATTVPMIHSHTGVPPLDAPMSPPKVSKTWASFTLEKNFFANTNGEVIAYGLFLLTSPEVPGFGFWNGTNESWPQGPKNSQQLTENFWNPFQNGDLQTTFVIGGGDEALKEDTEYYLLVRALTNDAYKDGPLLDFRTELQDHTNLGLILGLTFGILAAVVVVVIAVILYLRKKRRTAKSGQRAKRVSDIVFPDENFSS